MAECDVLKSGEWVLYSDHLVKSVSYGILSKQRIMAFFAHSLPDWGSAGTLFEGMALKPLDTAVVLPR